MLNKFRTMQINTHKTIIALCFCLLTIITGYYFHQPSTSTINDGLLLSPENFSRNEIRNSFPIVAHTSRWPLEIQRFIHVLNTNFSKKIHHIHIQAKIISFRELITNELSEPIEKNLFAILADTFPGYEESILDVWSRMDQYEEWLITENRTLIELNALNRTGMVWDKRYELFPIAATNIWHEEQDKYETAQLNLYSEIDQLDTAYNIPINDKIRRLEASFQQTSNIITSSFEQPSGLQRGTIASVLFGLRSVQKELQALDPLQRQIEVNNIRRELGYDENSIKKLEKIDTKREKRWSNGYAYMASRNQLLAGNDSVPEEQLDSLRDKFFGKSSETIAREEGSGFYRFERTRYFGRN